MVDNDKVFAEFCGLAIFDLQDLLQFQNRHKLGKDLLQAFTTLEAGDAVTKEGIAIPLSGISDDYYRIAVITDNQPSSLLADKTVVQSTGWILHTSSGNLRVCGIGYLKQVDDEFDSKAKYLSFTVEPGWYEVEIRGGITAEDDLQYEFLLSFKEAKPAFYGNLEDNFTIEVS